MAVYAHNIPSLKDLHPHLDNTIHNIDISQPITAGDAVLRNQAAEADTVALLMRIAAGQGDDRDREVATSAILRAHCITTAVSAAVIAPHEDPNQAGALIRRIEQLESRVERKLDMILRASAVNEANTRNLRILGKNQRLKGGEAFHPLQKTVHGDGIALARAVAPNAQVLHDLGKWIDRPQNRNLVHADVGDAPPRFDIEGYEHLRILQLIVFYNDDFGINVDDEEVERRKKIRGFFTDF